VFAVDARRTRRLRVRWTPAQQAAAEERIAAPQLPKGLQFIDGFRTMRGNGDASRGLR
jgi:hypothetical protein